MGCHNGDRFTTLAAFQTTSENSWNQHSPQASQFLLSLKLANSVTPDEVAKLTGKPATDGAPPPTLAGFGDAPAPVANTSGRTTPAVAPNTLRCRGAGDCEHPVFSHREVRARH